MPIRAAIAFAGDHLVTVASSLGIGLAGCVYWVIGTASPEPTTAASIIDATTRIQGSPYALFAIFGFGVTATWVVASLVNGIRNDVKANGEAGKKAWKDLSDKLAVFGEKLQKMDEKREETEKRVVAITTHIDDCPIRNAKSQTRRLKL